MLFVSQAWGAQASAPHRILLCSGGDAGAIHSAAWDSSTGEIGPTKQEAQIVAPTFLAFARNSKRTCAYVVSEANAPNACVSAYAVDPKAGALKLLNKQPSEGDGPTHVSVSPDRSMLAIASYTGGSITTYRIRHDGGLSAPVAHIQYKGHGPNAGRQESAHAHSARFSPDGRFLLVNNFGLDQILIYRVNRHTAELTPNTPPMWNAVPGSGPRHIAFHPNGQWIYSLNELDSTVDILHWDAAAGRITPAGRLSSLPEGFPPGTAFSGEIDITPDGRNLYIGNRVASDTVAVFNVEQDGGALQLIQLASNGGRNTRDFAIDPTGRWLVLCNVASETVVVLERSSATGRLSSPVHTYRLPKPMFAGFVPA